MTIVWSKWPKHPPNLREQQQIASPSSSGECRHFPRYSKVPHLAVLYQDEPYTTDEDRAMTREIWSRTARNANASLISSGSGLSMRFLSSRKMAASLVLHVRTPEQQDQASQSEKRNAGPQGEEARVKRQQNLAVACGNWYTAHPSVDRHAGHSRAIHLGAPARVPRLRNYQQRRSLGFDLDGNFFGRKMHDARSSGLVRRRWLGRQRHRPARFHQRHAMEIVTASHQRNCLGVVVDRFRCARGRRSSQTRPARAKSEMQAPRARKRE